MCKLERNGKSKISLLPIILIIIILMSSFSGCILKTKNSANPPEMSYYFNYDDNGRVTGYVDAEGNNIRYAYDKKGQIVETVYPDRKVNFTYDALGNLVTIKDEEGLVEFQYDAYNRLTKAKYKHSPERSIEFDYDPWDRIEKMRIIDNNNQVVNSLGYQYDMFSRLKSIETSKGLIEYSYNPVENKMIRQYPNGIKSTFIYSSQMLPSSLKHEDKMGNLLAEYKYDYDASGHVIKAIENFPETGIQETKYDWDNRGYLIGWTKPDGNIINYKYDSMGNRISKIDPIGTLEYKYDDFGRLAKTEDLKLKWDKTGKLTTRTEDGKIAKISYNSLDLPLKIELPDTTISYDWDAGGNLMATQDKNDITYYLPNPSAPSSIVAEFNKDGKLSSSYIYGSGLVAQEKNNEIQFFLEDGLGSIRTISDQKGKIVGQSIYSPFGELTNSWGETLAFSRKIGEQWDPLISRPFINNRLYDPEIGGYLSPRSSSGNIATPSSLNSYSLNPINSAMNMHSFLSDSLDIPKLIYYNPARNPITEDQFLLRGLTNDPFGTSPSIFRRVAENALVSFISEPIGELGGPYKASEDIFDWINFINGNRDFPGIPFQSLGINEISFVITRQIQSQSLMYLATANVARAGWDVTEHFYPITISHPYTYSFGTCGIEIFTEYIGPVFKLLTSKSPGDAYEAYTDIVSKMAFHVIGPAGYFLVAFENAYIDYTLRLLNTANDPLNPNLGTDFRRTGPSSYEYKVGVYKVKIEETNNGFKKEVTSPTSITIVEVERENTPGGGIRHKTSTSTTKLKKETPLPTEDRSKEKDGTPTPVPTRKDDGKGWHDGDGGGGGGPGGNIGNTILRTDGTNPLLQTPFSNEEQLGGIELSAKAKFVGDLGRITGAVYDQESGNIVLVGDGNISLPSLDPEDIRVAMEIALSNSNAQFSLDPADPKNPKGEWFKAVYIPEDILKGTRFGNELFEADWLLKQYTFGANVDENGKTSERITNVRDFKDMFDLSFENSEVDKKPNWNRFWIVNDKATLRKSDNAIYFDAIDMKVKTEQQHFTGKELKDSGKQDPDAIKFVEFFTAHYNEFAEESYSLERLKEMAKAVAMANWLVSSGIPIDMSWFSESDIQDEKFDEYMLSLSKRPNFKISETENGQKFVDQVHSLSEEQEKSTQNTYNKNGGTITETSTRVMNLFGGVDLTVNPVYISDDGQANRIKEKVREAIKENPGQIKLDLQDNGQKFKGIILPITQSGRSLWEDMNDGISNAEFIRDNEGKIQSFKLELDGGWTANAERTNDGGSEISLKTPNEHRFQYQYNPEGYLYQLNVDNNKVAEYQYDSKTRILSVGYNRFKEYMTYDDGGRVQSYKRVGQQLSESVQFNYDQEGRLKGIDYGELGKINLEYKGDLLANATTPWGGFNYTYDSGNRISAISESGNTVNFQYDGNLLKQAAADFQGHTSEIIFEDGLMKEILGFTGENMKYEYNEQGLLKSATDSQGAKAEYYYDDRLRLNRIELPSGISEEYVYGIVGRKGDTKERLIKKIVHPINSK